MPYLSIIIPCYNVADYLPTTLNSLSQLNNAEDCEFLFINDGSTDNTLAILQDFSKRDSRALVINQVNQGVSAARNAAIKIASGEYLLCLDGDDFLHPDTITIIQKHIQHYDALLAPCILVHSKTCNLQQLHIPNGIYSIEKLYTSCQIFPTAPMIVYRTAIIKDHQIYFNSTIKSGEVYDFTISFFVYATQIVVISQGFYYYVMRENSATHQPNYHFDFSVIQLLEHISSLQTSWASTPSFIMTSLKIVLSFTYNKYMKLGITDKIAINTIQQVFCNAHFQHLLSNIPTKRLTLSNKIYFWYIRHMPIKIGYFIGAYIMKLFAQLKKKL